ncbi:hypothetical protein ACFOY2_48480 [Nonomuraea purpurea]|uniref:Uncharacterized protein n=1 Tax=Nonomuraea purpurea TaxID=1849276 RepID=A0ABV8GMF1_9ACTN
MRRLAITSVLALAAASLPAGAAHASTFTCTSGTRTYLGDIVGYHIIASGCTGSGPVSGQPGSITITSGYYAGTWGCRSVSGNPSIGLASGLGC